ncbi:MAG: ATP synthase F1 subunit delta [Bacteroidales bacterium]|jgi:F-type H+-transporting ATPase subunit delta|nr:ATP synthase F1 subunit delta [Bacteroidales bacterium]
MRRPKIARRYAKAFFDFSEELNKTEDIMNDIHLIDSVFSENRELKTVICSPVVRVDKKTAIMSEIFKTKINEITLRYLTLILKKGREYHIDLICQEYEKLYKESKNIVTLYIESAKPLERQPVEFIRQKIKSYLEKEIEIVECINPRLIGGIQLHFNDYLLDASIQGAVDKLRKRLVDKSYEINF